MEAELQDVDAYEKEIAFKHKWYPIIAGVIAVGMFAVIIAFVVRNI